ncbi:hypothetical protein [Sphingobacterium griseoflavum]|uniref:Uncharacterized protein n=1 Tax=Sphingobacterium griseoflavum TaxID=1474952 RepID=A0ABQ3HQ09_9SPHI|nr:hypothetical protein [Sphingobacterium griseoflavum]GHE23328.1 hypothetical protein GCM10017764_02960 [Sphingobacterium griseoflavum]
MKTRKEPTDGRAKIHDESIKPDDSLNSSAHQSLETVAAIQDAYTQTMSRLEKGAMDSTFFDYDCHGERNGRVIYFTEKGSLVLIKHYYGEYSHHEVHETFFVRDGKPFFQFRRATSWSFEHGAAEGATKDQVIEQRIYLRNEQPFRCLQKNYVMRSKANDNPIPDQLPNKDVDCTSAASTLTSFALLAKYEQQPTTGCLAEK